MSCPKNNLSCSFVHLRIHSEYSITDSIIRIKQLVSRCAENNSPALALTDKSGLFGFIKFYKECLKHGIKPILGTDVLVTNSCNKKQSRLLLFAKNKKGYLDICTLLTRAYQNRTSSMEPLIQLDWLTKQTCEHLIALSGYENGEIGQWLLHQKEDKARQALHCWQKRFDERFYLEIQRSNSSYEDLLKATAHLGETLSVPLVATHPVQFINKEDFGAHEAKVCITNGWKLTDQNKTSDFKKTQYLISEQEAQELFAGYEDALSNTIEIAKQCNLLLELGLPKLPRFPIPNQSDLGVYLNTLAHQKSKALLNRVPLEQKKTYEDRLVNELDIINEMGFSGYFLIVQDFINWAKNNNVPVGPGRGSGAGSIVAFVLGITELDPIKYDLLFERFLNPERISMPDFDIDFCQEKRQLVIDYVKNKYGTDAVSQIATFGTMAAKAAIRDIGRILNLPYPFVDGIAKLIPFEPGKNITIDAACEMEPLLKERIKNEEDVRQCISLAKEIEGLVRNISTHAGGILIAPEQLVHFCPLFRTDNSQDMLSQYDKEDVEEVGLVKFDFLGLKTLTIIDWTLDMISQLNPNQEKIIINQIELTDPKTYDLLCEGNTTGVFQLESRGMRELLKKLRPSNFEDIIAVLALYRPGPLGSGMVDEFINRKHGKATVNYYHPDLEPILKPTYGIIVYQEQVMLISRIIAGYSLGSADLLRRAMGKKKTDEMSKHRKFFIEGAQKNNYSHELATHLFNLMEKFAEYGFNKSHSAAYAVIAYQTAWLKKHHPACFMAASLSLEMDDTDKVKILHEDALKNNINILPPDINQSTYKFIPIDQKTIRYGLGAIKGVGQNAALEIQKKRLSGHFSDLYDFCARVDLNTVNKRSLEFLIKGGAFDSLSAQRSPIYHQIKEAMHQANLKAQNSKQINLFELPVSAEDNAAKYEEWSLLKKLSEEKSAIGFFISGHPFDAFCQETQKITSLSLSNVLNTAPNRNTVTICGIVSKIRKISARLYILLINDSHNEVEVNLSADQFEQNKHLIKIDSLVFFDGVISFDNYQKRNRFLAQNTYCLEQIREKKAKKLLLRMNEQSPIDAICSLIEKHASPDYPACLIILYKVNHMTCEITTDTQWKVRVSTQLLSEFNQLSTHIPNAYTIHY